jgi:hypothetical protein
MPVAIIPMATKSSITASGSRISGKKRMKSEMIRNVNGSIRLN